MEESQMERPCYTCFSCEPDQMVLLILIFCSRIRQWLFWKNISGIIQYRWFAKRFLHPDIVFEYDYIFLWDEDIGVQNFNPIRWGWIFIHTTYMDKKSIVVNYQVLFGGLCRYVSIVKEEGLEISQPALDSGVHHLITARSSRSRVHR